MAFVFRSQKQSLFQPKIGLLDTPQSDISNEQSQLNGTDYSHINSNLTTNQPPISPSRIFKGLPYLLRKTNDIKTDNFKENDIFQDPKNYPSKLNSKPIKKVTASYFFSSNVPRDINKSSSRAQNKNIADSQYNASTNDEMSILEQKKSSTANYLTKNIAVNKNILAIQDRTIKDFRRHQYDSIQQAKQAEKLLIDCSKEQNPAIKRKSSPPHNFDKTAYSSILQRIKSQKEKLQQNTTYEHGELCMKTQDDGKSQKRSQTQKKIGRLHKGNMQNSFYKEESDDSSEYQDEHATPGPGTYDNTINLKKIKSFRSKKQKFAKIFGSPLQRFKKQQVKYNEVTYVNEQNSPKPQKIRKYYPFLSNTPKFMSLQKKSKSPEPGFYDPRQSLQHDIVRNLLRNANLASFNSTLPRFKEEKSNVTPGPGQYNVDCLELAKLEEIRNNLSSCYKSQVQRCLNYSKQDLSKETKQEVCTIQGLIDKKHKNYVIHKRQQQFDISQFYSPPAFFSGVERFKDAPKDTSSVLSASLQPKLFSQQIKNVQPFNSSEQRKLSETIGQGVGVGSYMVDKDKWNKKSYNIFFH